MVWNMEYTWANFQEVFPSTTTLSGTETISEANQYKSLITPVPDTGGIDATGKKISSILKCRLYRDPGDSADTFNGDAFILSIDFHIEVNMVGSREQYVK